MEPTLVFLGFLMVAAAVYVASDPMERSRSWVSPREWTEQPEAATEKQYWRTMGMAGVLAGLGLFLVLFGATA
ncbi:hypothetical protein [Halostella salina]|uniref:hypothetical protein n=1 Tax=Halostella salina TaxID=1547897 RepID=UPI000EF812E9|nr:hypothetical protein [Halostella salina]